ncbi:MAG: methionine ABC transporter permease [Bacillota bacterium]|nr:methionine ABC transporter permease [Bacillota bacterium]
MFLLTLEGLLESLYMCCIATVLAYCIGIPLGVLLVLSAREGICPRPRLNLLLGGIVNCLRSIPFLILMVALLPFTRFVVGSSIGWQAATVALVVAAAPFVARVVEASLKEVDPGVIEAAQAMGAGTMQIVCKVLLPEARPGLLVGAALSVTAILGYSAMAGIVGGGGLGAIAINYGYYRSQTDIMLIMILILLLLVQIFQGLGNLAARKSDKRMR